MVINTLQYDARYIQRQIEVQWYFDPFQLAF